MECKACGFENEEGALFCESCGAALSPDAAASGDSGGVDVPSDGESRDDAAGAGGGGVDDSSDHLGPYELRGELGRGAMARVWRAWDPNLGREVAIKEPLFDATLGDDVREEMGRRFVREAKTAARLNHAGIVTIYAADVYGGRPAIVMELVDGATLGDILENGPLAPDAALDALDQLLDAVGYAHANGVVHRDIKPENIFVNSAGRVKLADFGIARVDDGAATRATMVGTVLGTPGYMSPEQAKGGAVDGRSDLFSIGVVGYEMLSGRNPFGAGDGSDSTTLLYRIVHEPADELPDASVAGLPVDLRPAIMAALAKDPVQRPQTASDFKAMLHGGAAAPIQDASNLAGAVGKVAPGKAPKWLPYVLVAAVCAIVLLVVLLGALSGGGGGGGGGGAVTPQSTVQSSSQSSGSSTSATAYLAVREGKVAIYVNSSAEPYEVTDVEVADLDDDAVAEVEERIGFSSVEEAQAHVREYKAAIKAVKEAEEKRAAEEAEAQKKAEAEAKAQAAANTWYVCANEFVTLRSGTSTQSASIVRIPVRAAVEYLGDAGSGWSRVSYNGQTGYVITKFISSDPNAPLVYDDV